MPAPAAELHAALLARGQTVSAAESLTAGMFCAALAGVPGASATLRGGLVVYATDLKATLAGVDAGLLAEHGPVSPQTAGALARGVRSACRSDWGVGLTGVAGPDPVGRHAAGLVFVGIAGPGLVRVERLQLDGDRAVVREQAVGAATDLLLECLAGGNGAAAGGVTP